MPEILSNFSEEAVGSGPDQHKELDELLVLAEQLQGQVDLWDRRALQPILAAIFCAFLGAAPIIYWFLQGPPHAMFDSVVLFGGATVSWTAFIVIINVQLERVFRRRRREQNALEEVISLIREVEQTYGKDQHWSALDRAKFRIRLSRFTVGQSRGGAVSGWGGE